MPRSPRSTIVRDVQGAQYVTTLNVPRPYTTQSPQVCANPALLNPSLVLGLYRPAISGAGFTAPALSVAYWVTTGPTAQLVRDSCTLTALPSGSTTTTFADQGLISDNVSPSGVSATISPGNFSTDAGYGWTPTSTSTSVTASTPLRTSPSFTLPVVSTSGFQSGPVGVRSDSG